MAGIDPYSIGIGLLGTGINYFQAQAKRKQALEGIAQLEKLPESNFSTGEQIYGRANNLATGLTPQEIANEEQGYNRLANERYRLGVAKNPSLSGAVNAGVNYGSVQNTLGLAAQDAAARRNSLHSLISLIGNQANRQTGKILDAERAYGQAASDQSYNQTNAVNNLTNSAFTYSLYNNLYGNDKPINKFANSIPPTIG